ncbi:MAG: citrulline utilization hydrolase CtlX [Chthoniobacterales bacterium]
MTMEAAPTEQSARAVVMIRPSRFYPNPETALDNAFQQDPPEGSVAEISTAAQVEFDHAVEALRRAGVTVEVFEDTLQPAKPDAVFPNNWFTTHPDGRIALYPMFTPSRRAERRPDLIAQLRERYQVTEVVDYSPFETRGLFLEGTGSLVLDHVHRLAYVSLSKRADLEPLHKFCTDFHFEPITFESVGADGRPIYHTNVMMCIAAKFALVGLEMIPDRVQQDRVRQSLEGSGKILVELKREQIENFAGNALELRNEHSSLLVLSSRAAAHLRDEQRSVIERFARLLPLDLPTIELAGGSARCMLATLHLSPR